MTLPLPEAFLDSLANTAGFDKDNFLAVHQQSENRTSIRYNPQKLDLYKGDLPNEKIPWSPYGYYLSERPSFTHDPLFHAGLYYVQEAGSQFIWEALSQIIDRHTEAKVLDLCAAPGGKTTLLAAYFQKGIIVANEVIKSRTNILMENITKWGSENVVITNNDPSHFSRIPDFFDVALIDAPCSGSGLFRKDNNAISEWSEENVLLCSRRQQRILADMYPSIKEDGLIIYSTCSYSPQEDEDNLDWLMQNFQLENIPLQIQPEWGITAIESREHKAIGYKFYPDKVRSEGFFIAVFRKMGGASAGSFSANNFTFANKDELSEIRNWTTPENKTFIKENNYFLAIDEKWLNAIGVLQKNLYLRKAGITIGEIKNKGLVPAHDLAISTIFNRNINKINLDKAQSLQYLKRKDFEIDNIPKGWCLAAFEDLNLGWIKILPNRLNNYYPTEWRILKD
ncbi:methyltransferase RsmF C-terminal domain-like protein [Arachidicoccus soli]|uniref:RNA methyltransferase n=1 Tax=Arachidicoccus soli TaxID=2341117 RepID=A0A386HU80_9BACT|nr:RNA methyltransferase [Arachidicoccus soli]AYD48980.1 RNA methyltransferase [Arachidicoccus soli]